MGVEFYARKRGMRTKEILGKSYSGYNCIRTYLLGCFDFELAEAYELFERERTPRQKEMLNDISPWVPEKACDLFCASDCEGRWENEEVKGFIEELEKLPRFQSGETYTMDLLKYMCSTKTWCAEGGGFWVMKGHGICELVVNNWRNDAMQFIDGLRFAAAKGAYVTWY